MEWWSNGKTKWTNMQRITYLDLGVSGVEEWKSDLFPLLDPTLLIYTPGYLNFYRQTNRNVNDVCIDSA